MTDIETRTLTAAAEQAAAAPGLRLLAVFGSRARGDSTPGSDWDIAFLSDAGFDAEALRATLNRVLGTDRLDVVDLARAGGQIRYRVARDGKPLFARTVDEWPRFWMDAVSFWCDAAPVLRAAYAGLLEELGP